jgi:hydrogenase maturation protein HypF
MSAVLTTSQPSASEIRISGTVQGVGFRPTVWRLAREEGLLGEVLNDGKGVLIRTVGSAEAIQRLMQRIRSEAPVLARIESMQQSPLSVATAFSEFQIVESLAGENQTRIAADAAICRDCRNEVLSNTDRRSGYAFTNCTHCGPRFSIVHSVPYDRARTTMSSFPMCPACAAEFRDPADRRFHAQPIACPACGPRLWIEACGDPVPRLFDTRDINSDADCIAQAAACIRAGRILCLRGLGGFHLACDAGNAEAVARLRERKRRYAKPFALMARDIAMIERYCSVSVHAAELLRSPEAPIVVLQTDRAERLPAAIAPDLDLLGFMLPYTPLHVLLMEALDRPVVMTSANLSSEPQVIANQEAREKLRGIADLFLMHDREIANRIDDSVLRFAAGRPRLLRRARGYAPAALSLPSGFEHAPEILAFGAELKSTFCLVKEGAAVLSQHQGDLEDLATFEDYQKNLGLYAQTYDHRPYLLAVDLHPEYLSTKLGLESAETECLPVERIQHHHAHLASCMAENGLPLNTAPVLGLILDGLGMGEDGSFWGGELLLGDYLGVHRLASLNALPMLGGMRAIVEPWRSTYVHLLAAMPWSEFVEQFGDLDLHRRLQQKPLDAMNRMLAAQLNCPLASSCGRLFDAVAAAMGLCFDQAAYEGQGAMALEAAAARCPGIHLSDPEDYAFGIVTATNGRIARLDAAPMWRALLQDLARGVTQPTMAARFHRGLAQGLVDLVAEALRSGTSLANRNTVAPHDGHSSRPEAIALSGGCLQNAILLEALLSGLGALGLRVLSHEKVPANDGGIALGQAAITAARHLSAQSRPTEVQP